MFSPSGDISAWPYEHATDDQLGVYVGGEQRGDGVHYQPVWADT